MRSRRPHVAIVSLFFPPSRASGVFRPLAMANHYVRRGWDVTVVTVTPDFFDDITGSRDDTLLSAIDDRIRVERVRLPSQHLQRDVRRMTFWRTHAPRLSVKPAEMLQRRLVPDRYATWVPGVVARLLRVHVRRRIDVVLASGNPWAGFEAAARMNRLTRVPYVMDYRDSWTLAQFTEQPAFADDSPEVTAERRLVRGAARVVFVNEPMREWHAERYPDAADRMVVVENGYEPEVLGEMPFRPVPADRPLRLGYVGTITSHLPHRETWEGWAAARTRPELDGATVHLYGHLGFFPREEELIRAMIPGEHLGVHLEGAVGKADVRSAYDSLDVLLLLVPSSRYVTAGKTYESMATGKPIVAVHTPETAASVPMRGYPLAFPVERLDAPSVAAALVAAARAARDVTPEQHAAAQEHAKAYRREKQLEVLDEHLERVIDRAR